MAEFESAIPTILLHEGNRFVNDKDDPGGATKYGISLRFLKDFSKRDPKRMDEFDIDRDGDVDANDIALLTKEAAKMVYLWAFWQPDNLGLLRSQPLATKLLDVSVHCGPSRMRRWVLPTSQDEMVPLQPQAIARLNALNADNLISAVRARQIAHYHWCVSRKPTSEKYLAGWLKRAEL